MPVPQYVATLFPCVIVIFIIHDIECRAINQESDGQKIYIDYSLAGPEVQPIFPDVFNRPMTLAEAGPKLVSLIAQLIRIFLKDSP